MSSERRSASVPTGSRPGRVAMGGAVRRAVGGVLRGAVLAGSALSAAGAVHAVVNGRLLRRPSAGPGPLPRLSVLVPARNEAAGIGDCLAALGTGHEVLVLDDESDDGTADVATRGGARVLAGRPLPPGWLGKPWACAQLVEAADPGSEVLVFVDADVRMAPGGVAAAVRMLLDADLDIVCPFPRQLAGSVPERLVQPLLQWSWLTTLPLRAAERSARPSLTAACGQFVVVRRAALDRCGGFAAVRSAVLDDVALVRAVKSAGGRGGIVDGTDLAACRMYRDWPSVRDGYGKSLWSAVGSLPAAAAMLFGLLLVWVVPPVAALFGSRTGLAGYLFGVAGRVATGRRTGARVLPDAGAHPVSVGLLSYLLARSVVLRRYGVLRWKGRDIDAAR
ncbi:glycosyltransferase [Nakamurella endophytica]|uniref:Glycosyl transferase n=1 Tax=Nakamurella endophytica TaxID=1748367 RepID=A0A917WDG1_9ACTN|nr:glycosyltransferase [Nakamurella endophytica]GGL94189.1 glycosyl transferase [Nakamurella endophytica]